MQGSQKTPFVHYDLSWVPSWLKNAESTSDQDKMTKNTVHTENSHYTIVRYNKSLLNYDLVDTYGLLRSVIFDKNDKIVSFAPPKSMATELFIQKYQNLNLPFMKVEEFIEGTMINVFWDETIGLSGAWEIATRNSVGANMSFYQKSTSSENTNKTFRQMFLEAMSQCRLSFDDLIKGYTYSFVLQHPENRIVVPFRKPNLYLAAIYHCVDYSKTLTEEKHEIIFVFPMDVNFVRENTSLKNTLVQYPKEFQERTYTELIKKYASMNTPYDVMGIIIVNQMTGERCKIRNPVYEQVRQLKGNQAKLQYQYLSLRHSGKISEYLKFYPEHKKEFSIYRDDVHLFTKTLYDHYVECFIKKVNPDIHSYSKQYQGHMIVLHQKFLNELREQKKAITFPFIVQYVNEMHPSKLMFSMNFHLRKRNVEMQKEEYVDL